MNLVLSNDGAGHRHFLDGKPVHCGTQLRLRIASGLNPPITEFWVWARYEASFRQHDVFPTLHTSFGVVVPDETTFVRWPTEGEQ